MAKSKEEKYKYNYHRDLMGRVIKSGDYCIWTNKKRKQGIDLVRVIFCTEEKVKCLNLTSNTIGYKYPENLMVVTQQLDANLRDNVGANQDLEERRNQQQ